MNEQKPRLSRLTAILTRLQGTSLVTARELADRHGVSIRTIYRDIRTLEKSGIPVFTEEGKGYSLVSNYRLPPVMFTEEEANALLTAGRLLATNRDNSLRKAHAAATEKIRAVLPRSARERREFLESSIQVRDNPGGQLTSDYLMRLQSAIGERQVTSIEYADYSGKISSRSIEPFALYTTEGNWIVVAHCRLRNDFRAFRLDRIIALQLRNEHFSPHGISLEQYFEQCRRKFISTPDIPLSPVDPTFGPSPNNHDMESVKIAPFNLIGITVRTNNTTGKSASDISALWQRFMNEQLVDQIPHKIDSAVLSLYTDYVSDHLGEFTTVLGCRVASLDEIPAGMEGFSFAGGSYQKFTCRGNLQQGVVYTAWTDIWKHDLDRTFVADFEVYDFQAMNPEDAEVEIYVGVE